MKIINKIEDYYYENRENLGGMLLVIIGFLALFGIFFGITKIREYFDSQPKHRPYVFACPVDKSTKCYKILADEPNCISSYEDEGYSVCEEYEVTVYFPNGGNLGMDCIPSNKNSTLECIDENDKEWELEISGDHSKEKYYPDGSKAQ